MQQKNEEDDVGSKGQESIQEDGDINNNIQQVTKEGDLSPKQADKLRGSNKNTDL